MHSQTIDNECIQQVIKPLIHECIQQVIKPLIH